MTANISVKMFHLNESFYKQEMPARAKRLFIRTFKKYHKLDGGDEDVALHMVRQAVDREYVKLNNHWIPKTAAEEIVRHDIDEDSLSESENASLNEESPSRNQQSNQLQPRISPLRRDKHSHLSDSDESVDDYAATSSSSDDDDDDDENISSHSHKNKLLFK